MSSCGIEGSQTNTGVGLGEPGLRSVLVATIFVITSFALINLCFVLANSPSTFKVFPKWLMAQGAYDSWRVMRSAYEWLQEEHAVTVYQEIFFNLRIKFQYPLTSLLPFFVLDYLGIEPLIERFNYLNALLQVVGALAAGALSALLLRKIRGNLDVKTTLSAAVLGTVTFVTFYPTMRAFELGQIQVWINVMFCFAVIFWLSERPFLVGMSVGIICLMKPQFSMFLI